MAFFATTPRTHPSPAPYGQACFDAKRAPSRRSRSSVVLGSCSAAPIQRDGGRRTYCRSADKLIPALDDSGQSAARLGKRRRIFACF
ncbi:hypothetical protein HYQ45_003526 [Verticillium longisporum]|uniref:Uncharacterized protein n=2 Tax=Verticillium TaxID=1036719 RepID=A0A8I2ZW82_VERLO|nr:hypothetical protein HYQ45_003526 [Verticillium longisporum]RXG41770.1 hypothetical protein VDGE_30700 [Verticillium dahliae]